MHELEPFEKLHQVAFNLWFRELNRWVFQES